MSMAFEITPSDVRNVMRQNGHEADASIGAANRAFDEIDLKAVEDAALNGGCEIESQTDAAHEEIRSQLVDLGWLPIQIQPAMA